MTTTPKTSYKQPQAIDTKQLHTQQALASSDHDIKLKCYQSIMNANSLHPYRYFVTLTFSKPMIDEVAVCTSNLHVKRFIKRKLYNRRAKKSDLKFVFFIEPHTLQHQKQNKLHVHFLMTECKDSLLKLEALSNEQIQLMKLQYVLKDVFSRIYCFDNRVCAKIAKFDIQHVYDNETLIDYLTKQLRRQSVTDITSMIDFNNSDLRF